MVVLLDDAVSREPVTGHDGRSGATLERVVLADGARLIVKTCSFENDLTAAIGGRVDRELVLWRDGHLDDLPPGVGHALLEVFWQGDQIVTVMRDLGDAVIGWGRAVTAAECARIAGAAAALHGHHAGAVPPDLIALEDRLVMLGPRTIGALDVADNPLPALVRRGWEVFDDLVPAAVATAVTAIFDDPALLAGPLRSSAPQTLIHGDFGLVNLALEQDTVVLLDWGIATAGPGVVDLASFLVNNASALESTREQVIADYRAAAGELITDTSLRLGLLAGLLELGWNKALDAVDHSDPATRARERADLDWWVAAARPALEGDL